MSVWLNKTGHHPDGGHRPSRRTTVRPKFQKFHWKSFLFESSIQTVLPCRPDGHMFAASNFHIKASHVRTGRMVVRTVALMHAISLFDTRVSGPGWLASRRLDLNCDTCLMDERVRTGIHIVRTIVAIFTYLCFGKKSWSLIEHWEWSGRVAESSGRMQAGAVWSFSTQRKVWTGIHVVRTDDALVWCASGRFDTSSGRLMHWTAGRPDGMTRRPGG
jgi:hypothetical protein